MARIGVDLLMGHVGRYEDEVAGTGDEARPPVF
jgi:hypothetical protein